MPLPDARVFPAGELQQMAELVPSVLLADIMNGSKSAVVPDVVGIAARAAGGGAGAVTETACRAVRDLRQSPAPAPVLPSHQKRGVSMADDWPLRSYLELGALPSAVPCARLHTRQVLWEWGITELSEQVELLTSELTTNAMRASRALEPASPIRLWLLSDKARVVILVWDGNPRPPVRVEAAEGAESGRGLVLVEAISEEWGWYAASDLGGKWVWCRVASDDQTAAHPPDDDTAEGA